MPEDPAVWSRNFVPDTAFAPSPAPEPPMPAHTCASCRWWEKHTCVEWGACGLADEWQERLDSTRQAKLWLSHHDMSRLNTDPDFYCSEWEPKHI